jgi:hypothetical protein
MRDRLEFLSRKIGCNAPLDVIRYVDVDDGVVVLTMVGFPETKELEILPETVLVGLKSGKRQVVLDAPDFADAVVLVCR